MTKSAKRFFIDAAGAFCLLNQGYTYWKLAIILENLMLTTCQEHNI